ncbi:MAG: M23 family metallopeptidase [Ruminococcaceae bacterium]|nr:M23 family metallopeptidase [Oscillospiraceae bacterium]
MKKKNDSETTARIKKQLISTGVYIALAAVVVGITANSVKDILGSTKGYEIPEFDNSGEKIVFPQIDGSKDLADNGGKYELPSQKDYSFPDISVSENPSGVNAEITEPVPDDTDSVEPESVSEKNPEEKEETLPKAEPKKEPSVRLKPAAGYISREFSKDELLYTPTMNDFRTHNGIDITGDIGSPVCSFADGVVEDIYDDPFMGTTVVISHSGGLVSSYSNLSKELPAEIYVGAVVSVGDTIGGIGETAIIESAEVPHVHFEIYKDEVCVNPEDYLTAN